MTHLYTLLVGGVVVPGLDEPAVSAIAWADDTIIALGSDEVVRSISRGDSHLIELDGAVVVPLATGYEPHWPSDATLTIGGIADLAVIRADPRGLAESEVGHLEALALVRGGRVVAGRLTGLDEHDQGHDRGHGLADQD